MFLEVDPIQAIKQLALDYILMLDVQKISSHNNEPTKSFIDRASIFRDSVNNNSYKPPYFSTYLSLSFTSDYYYDSGRFTERTLNN